MRESRTYGSVRGGHRKVLVYSREEAITWRIEICEDPVLERVFWEMH